MPFSNLAFSSSFGVGFDRIDPPEDTGTPTGSGNGGWQMPHYEKENKRVVEIVQPEVELPEVAKESIERPKLKLVVPAVDKSLEEDQQKLLQAEIKALELTIARDSELKAQAIQAEALRLEAAEMLLREQHKAEELMVMLLLMEV